MWTWPFRICIRRCSTLRRIPPWRCQPRQGERRCLSSFLRPSRPCGLPDRDRQQRRLAVSARSSIQTAETAQTAEADQTAETAETASQGAAEASTLAYVLYSDQNLPDNVCLEQALLGFDYCTPVMGTLTSDFGYREHPVEGEERFHYGIDIGAAARDGDRLLCRRYRHRRGGEQQLRQVHHRCPRGGLLHLYAHCSRIIASSGASVKEGDVIAEVGETGVATGPHLHFELHEGSQYLNPIYYVSLA